MTNPDLKAIEAYLSTHSYIHGYEPSQADVAVYHALGSRPGAHEHPHTSRWYKHIHSYEAQHHELPGDKEHAARYLGGAKAAEEDDDDVDLFGSDEEEDAEAERLKAERVAAYAAKKAHKPKTIAKSVVTLDVKPWDDETDMEALEKSVRGIEMDGLLWGSGKLVAVGYGIRKFQVTLVIEDDKVSLDDLQEKIQEFEDYVQSTDVVAMQKL